jgi:hypothetical protein
MQANRHMGASGGDGPIARLVDLVEDHWYVGKAGEAITFDASVPASNPFVRGYTRGSRLRRVEASKNVRDRRWEADRAA